MTGVSTSGRPLLEAPIKSDILSDFHVELECDQLRYACHQHTVRGVRVVALVLYRAKVLCESPGFRLVAMEREAPHLGCSYGHV